MAEEFIEINRDIISAMDAMPGSALKVYLVLVDRAKAQKSLRVGLSIGELARSAGLGASETLSALSWLTHPSRYNAKMVTEALKSFIEMEEKPTSHRFDITLSSFYLSDSLTMIPFTTKNTDETKIKTLEAELQRVALNQTRQSIGETSGIASILKGDDRNVIFEIETDLGRGLSTIDAYFVGKLISAFGPARVSTIWKTKAIRAKDPIKTLSSVLWNGAAGKPAKEREVNVPTQEIETFV